MKSKGTIEIIQTGATTAKVIVNGRDISGMVSSYTINHNANDVARLELIMSKPFVDVQVEEICKVTIRQEIENNGEK